LTSLEPTLQPHYWVIIPAAGVGKRMGGVKPKQYLTLSGKTVLEHSLDRMLEHNDIEGAVIALSDDDLYWKGLGYRHNKSVRLAPGGKERCDSVLNALQILSRKAHDADWVLVHDAARPCVRLDDIQKLIEICKNHSVGGILAVPVRDTIKKSNEQNEIIETVDRTSLWHAQTPQMFRLGMLRDALASALDKGVEITDESSAMEWAGYKPLLVEGHADNIKITRKEDANLARYYLENNEKC
jgi:2-C-methyl-D-erythritol 4-phosphate cytidylyltransferase